ncbi:hypothetical protein RUM43_007159 [Polyplax serrata]|uniref:Chromatin target of PRMT1 protein C-terminal domain-containing protein n=1 Tax=Polyplax serrata TaxID=468196 RepID=A0AAN8P1H2_POLSC
MKLLKIRFTYLQKKARPSQTSILTIRAKNSAQQQASAKNRRLAMQMEKRLSAMAALKIKKKSIRQRLGIQNAQLNASVRDRLTLPMRGKAVSGRGRLRPNRGRSLQRSLSTQSVQQGNLKRTGSVQSLQKNMPRAGRSRSRSISRARTPSRSRANSVTRQPLRSPSVGRQTQKANFGRQGRFRSASFGQGNARPNRARRNSVGNRNQKAAIPGAKFASNVRRGRGRGGQRGRGNFQRNVPRGRNEQMRGKRGRGRGRPTPRGRGRGGQTKVIMPTKEELDKQLEQYMANTKSHLDREIDTYMKESGLNEFQ